MAAREDTLVMEDSRSDAVVIEVSLRHPAEFGRVFGRHWDAVFRFFERRIGSDAAQDQASEVFRIAFQRRDRFLIIDGTSCLPWLYGIAANLALKERRRFARHISAVDRYNAITTNTVDDHAVEVAAQFDSEEIWVRVHGVLSQIDPVSREMLLLIAWEGLSYQQVAAAFDVPIGTVRSRIHRTRSRLRSAIDSAPQRHIDTEIRERKP